MPSANSKRPPSTDTNVITCLGLVEPIDIEKIKQDLAPKTYGCIKFSWDILYIFREKKIVQSSVMPMTRNTKKSMNLQKSINIPVVFHTGDTQAKEGKLKYADPIHIDEVAVDNPNVTFVIAHCGNPWYQTAAEVAYKNKNVFLECPRF
jgi:hypothetical protein